MNHLIVVAHPLSSSLTMSLTRLYAAELEKLGHAQRTYDLYRMGFNPVLSATELGNTDHPTSFIIRKAQEEIRAADVLTAIYPLWWLSMPAMMKGYIDRVLARGFAYEAHNGVVRGLLSGKKCVLITLSAAPLAVLQQNGRWDAVLALQDAHIFRSAGFDLLEHLHFDNVEPHLAAEISTQYMSRIQTCVREHFPRWA